MGSFEMKYSSRTYIGGLNRVPWALLVALLFRCITRRHRERLWVEWQPLRSMLLMLSLSLSRLLTWFFVLLEDSCWNGRMFLSPPPVPLPSDISLCLGAWNGSHFDAADALSLTSLHFVLCVVGRLLLERAHVVVTPLPLPSHISLGLGAWDRAPLSKRMLFCPFFVNHLALGPLCIR